MTYIVSVGIANAAVRDENSITRQASTPNTSRIEVARRATQQSSASRATTARTTANTTSRQTSARTTQNIRTSVPTRTTNSTTISRAATPTPRSTTQNTARTATNKSRPARATINTTQSQTFGTGYNACRDAYFTCMDQFCATQNETYRRCTCSSRLSQIQSRENLLSDTANQLQDFKDFNLSVIDKSASDVTAMLTATSGETTAISSIDKSAAAQQLANIGAVLAAAKSHSLSTAGTLDIAGDIKQIWQTTDLTDGANIANLTGESLYNAVHAQCSQMVADTCESKSTLNMIVSAYGMYIENDCTILSNSLDSQTTTAKGAVRETEHEMHIARLENYNAHNSTSINDCIANVRTDLTADNACGPNYVHCLDVTGRYLNRDTGAPIYSANFYQLNTMSSLSGNILTNQANRLIVAELNRMRTFAEHSLDTCRDIADAVWDEFVRQAITEIYQGQQSAIRTVKNECLDVVNACYDEKSQSLKDFSNIQEQLLLGQRLELSEELCREKLTACSNLYGGGSNGLQELISAMSNLTDSKIAKSCRVTLQDFARNMCAVPSNDTLHGYPYGCRTYSPGSQMYAQFPACNQQQWRKSDGLYNDISESINKGNDNNNTGKTGYVCENLRVYTSCNEGFYLKNDKCYKCPDGCECTAGTEGNPCESSPDTSEDTTTQETKSVDCGDYLGSLYQRLVRYALETCVRPSNANSSDYAISGTVLGDVNSVMDSIRVDMGVALATECERLGGTWVDTKWIDEKDEQEDKPDNEHDVTGDTLFKKFYDETGANTSWGYCALTLGNETEEKNKETLEQICTKLNGIWKSIAWVDNIKNKNCCAAGVCATGDGTTGIDGCHDYNNDILLPAFYSETMVDTKAGYCAENH